jgi:hypothetical protein
MRFSQRRRASSVKWPDSPTFRVNATTLARRFQRLGERFQRSRRPKCCGPNSRTLRARTVDGAVAEPAFAFSEQYVGEPKAFVQRERCDVRAEAAHDSAPGRRVQAVGDELIVFVELAVGCRRAFPGGLDGGANIGCELVH